MAPSLVDKVALLTPIAPPPLHISFAPTIASFSRRNAVQAIAVQYRLLLHLTAASSLVSRGSGGSWEGGEVELEAVDENAEGAATICGGVGGGGSRW